MHQRLLGEEGLAYPYGRCGVSVLWASTQQV